MEKSTRANDNADAAENESSKRKKSLSEARLGEILYSCFFDHEKDYLTGSTEKGIKLYLSFSRDPAENQRAENGLKAFLDELYS
ncbi:hypothetical protein [Bacillus sp. MUM 13]|uniref:hypothetical protein n=1 Tax=Bacillus sp. MUM 13 TaxID=1678001 RepID=UPI0008F5D825|nr:hypothetical protein [Bacillus sp. MUM 13]OIK14135.1 hypothetical protein BIV59_04120 [Bacillus sp. MUM 13]